jgi:HK97 gp10 family phage protein
MAEVFRWKIKGAREMEALLKKLGPIPAGAAGDTALRKGCSIIVREARRLVKVRTGEMKRNISYAPNTRTRRKDQRSYLIGVRPPVSRRFHLLEFGRSGVPAQPFMRPAFDSQAEAALNALGETLGEAICAEANKLAKRGRR